MLILAGNWWAFVLRGIAAILFGLLAILLPGITLLTLVLLWGFYAALDGILSIMAAFRRTSTPIQPWWALLIEGIVGIAAGVFTFIFPGLSALVLLYVIAAWAVITGVMELIAANRLRKHIQGEWVLVLGGLLSIALGVCLFLFPGAGALALVIWIGVYALIFGGLLVGLGLKIRKWSHGHEPMPPTFPNLAGGH